MLMVISAGLQLSLVSGREWESLFGKVDRAKRRMSRSVSSTYLRSASILKFSREKLQRSKSSPLTTNNADTAAQEAEKKLQ